LQQEVCVNGDDGLKIANFRLNVQQNYVPCWYNSRLSAICGLGTFCLVKLSAEK